MYRNKKRWLLVFTVITSVLFIDQLSKQIVVDNLNLYESFHPIPALSAVFGIHRTANTGAAFGFLPQAGDIFLVLAVVVIIGMLFFYPRIPDEAYITRIATGLVCGGALGNALDRIRYGHVVDFIHYQIPGVISNVSNLADHAIVLGVILILIDSWRLEREEQRRKKLETASLSQTGSDVNQEKANNS